MEEQRISFNKRLRFKDRCLRLACCHGNQGRGVKEQRELNMNFRRHFSSGLDKLIQRTLNGDVEQLRAITGGGRLSKMAIAEFSNRRDLLVDEFDDSVIQPGLYLLGHEILHEDDRSVHSFKTRVADVVLEISRSSKLISQIHDLLPQGATTSFLRSYASSDYTDLLFSDTDSLGSESSILISDDSDLALSQSVDLQ